MRGGTSKGGYFLKDDLPSDPEARNALLLRIMGSPDPRQIDGMGGADPLTSKVAVVSRSSREGVDVDYLFLQVFVDQALVSDAQNCGNILAGIGPFALERGLVAARDGETKVTFFMENTGQIAVATVQTPGGTVTYDGDARFDGVPGTTVPRSGSGVRCRTWPGRRSGRRAANWPTRGWPSGTKGRGRRRTTHGSPRRTRRPGPSCGSGRT